MSTRSGKRIHKSLHENTLDGENDHVYRSERKTRSKRQKENGESTEAISRTKRKNYVSYPKNSDSDSAVEVPNMKEEETLTVLRKTALKEQNWNVSNTAEFMEFFYDKRPKRQTRQTKKFPENDINKDAPPELTAMEAVIDKSEIKKNKKKRRVVESIENKQEVVMVSKKKTRKKKKISSQSQLDVLNSTQNNSSVSLDSFHSAAGSPSKDMKANATFDKSTADSEINVDEHNVITADNMAAERKRSSSRNTTVDKINGSLSEHAFRNKRYSTRNSTFEISEIGPVLNSTFDKEDKQSKSNVKDATFDKIDISNTSNKLNTTFDKDTNIRRKSMRLNVETVKTVDYVTKNHIKTSDSITTLDKDNKPNSTFDKTETQTNIIADSKCSMISSDDNSNLTSDKSDDGSRISITSLDSRSGDSRVENIVNTTPMLIESSMDELAMSRNSSVRQETNSEVKPAETPMKREGTFTKDNPEVSHSLNVFSEGTDRTPPKHLSLPSPGSTPFPFSKSSQKEKCMLNVTRSLEKEAARKSLSVEPTSRTTRVMFCSPVNNPAVVMQLKGKVIKSNLKGSNKSFIFEDSDTSTVRAAHRKRSYTHNDVDEARAKRKRLADHQQLSIDRLSRPRTSSSTAKSTEPSTPSKKIPTPAKSKSDSKMSRTKLPNFAALHKRQFEKMESLVDCQQRKTRRARQLLTPTGSVNVLQRNSPKDDAADSPTSKPLQAPLSKRAKKTETPFRPPLLKIRPPPPDSFKPSLPTLDSIKPGYTRFGFKITTENPFKVPHINVTDTTKTTTRLATSVPTKSTRREMVKQTVMREKSFTMKEKRNAVRNENRTIIKGVRTNRRFDLQMQMRNIC